MSRVKTELEEIKTAAQTTGSHSERAKNTKEKISIPPNIKDAPRTTYSGSPITPIEYGLPRTTLSVCPECARIIEARLFEDDGRVMMEKTCPEHGLVRDVVYGDVDLYMRMLDYTFGDGRGVINPAVTGNTVCPSGCGLCNMHASHTALANIDLTNRCNLTCPICFAHANATGCLYEPSFEEIIQQLQVFRDEKPVPAQYVQFSGGEPTIYPRFLDVVRSARDMGFTHIQVATNGIKFLSDEFCEAAAEAGVHTLYLQFDGVTDDIYLKTRGQPFVEDKLKMIENCRKVDIHIVFVPTIIRGINDHQLGDMLKLAIENIDIMTGVAPQPVCFTGRISKREREAKRITLADIARLIEEQTDGQIRASDWIPLSCINPFSKYASALKGEEVTGFTCHPICSAGTYVFVQPDGTPVQITDFMDVLGMLKELDELSRKTKSSRIKVFSKAKALQALHKYFDGSSAPEGLTFQRFLHFLDGMKEKEYGRGDGSQEYGYPTLMVAGMHFMDSYNFDIERVRRCVVHYSDPSGRMYPFCSYNSGPCYRDRVESRYACSDDEVLRKAEEENYPPELQRLVDSIRRK
jgi:hypothetical protein